MRHAIPDAIGIAEAGARVAADVLAMADGATPDELAALARDGRAFVRRIEEAHERAHARAAEDAAFEADGLGVAPWTIPGRKLGDA